MTYAVTVGGGGIQICMVFKDSDHTFFFFFLLWEESVVGMMVIEDSKYMGLISLNCPT